MCSFRLIPSQRRKFAGEPQIGTSRENSESLGLHSRPRLDVIDRMPQLVLPPQARGGLPPRALRRVREYIESRLEENIALGTLAKIAGFSKFHFARAFKQSEGVTPHGYLVERRVEWAQKLLTGANLSLQRSHLRAAFRTRAILLAIFRQRVGVSPSMFRWSKH
jgi:AraC-like DNA-binding protein